MGTKIVRGKLYSCLALRLSKGKEITKYESKENYLFDVSKAYQIFDYLLKDQQIRQPNKHKIPLPKELKNRKYCKWHHSYSHAMVNCVVFRNVI